MTLAPSNHELTYDLGEIFMTVHSVLWMAVQRQGAINAFLKNVGYLKCNFGLKNRIHKWFLCYFYCLSCKNILKINING